MPRFVLLLLCCIAFPVAAADMSGRVFVDRDGDGRRDPREPGVAGVKVSNGRDIVVTDGGGRYRIAVRDGDTVFAIKPPGHAFALRGNGLPGFWRHHFPRGSLRPRHGGIAKTRASGAFDVALTPQARTAAELDVLVFADSQPKTALQAGYFERDIVESVLAERPGAPAADLGLTLGDVVEDDLSLYPQMIRATARLRTPWLHVPGNHDIDFDVPDDAASTLTFRNAFGPDTYAWEEAGTAFVVLDDVIYLPGQKPAYVGGLRADQFAFLERYLATLPDTHRVVLAIHIPLFDAPGDGETFRRADRIRLFGLLARFRQPLVLSGHSHTQRHVFHGADSGWTGAEPLHEYNVGAACGGYWSGVPDERGIPDARMADGTPNGYARVAFAPQAYRMHWVATGMPEAQRAMLLSAPRVLRRGAYPAFGVHANVYMGTDDTRVEYRIDDGAWAPMRRLDVPDPALVALNVLDDLSATLRSFDRSVSADVSRHLWRGTLPTDLASGDHRIEVRAFTRWDGEVRAVTGYRLDDAPPSATP